MSHDIDCESISGVLIASQIFSGITPFQIGNSVLKEVQKSSGTRNLNTKVIPAVPQMSSLIHR